MKLIELLERPLIIFDIESTGTDVVLDRIVQLAASKIIPEDFVQPLDRQDRNWLFNPGRPIPAEVVEIHHIDDAKVKDCPRFEKKAEEVFRFFAGADLCGFNLLNFDVPMLVEEFSRSGYDWDLNGVKIVDASEIFRRKEPRTLTAAVKKFCGRDHEGAHDAMADLIATWDVLNGQRDCYPDIGEMNLAGLAEFSSREEFKGRPARRLDLAGYIIEDADGIARYTLRKVRGVPVVDDPGFGGWMLRNSFPTDTKKVLAKLLQSYP
jgi:DNA polymerase-3 subunit epsilon